MSTAFDRIKAAWLDETSKLSDNYWNKRLAAGEVHLGHYIGFLIETYHNAGMNPQLQAFSTMYFKEKERDVIKKYYRHAISEIGHDLLALEDLKVLGVNEDAVVNSRPLPTTTAFLAYFFYKIQMESPLWYLGYLFHLEFTPTQNGKFYMEMLESKGVPREALTFIHEHATVDIAHNKLMEAYVNDLLKTENDIKIVEQSVRDATRLHSLLLAAAFENGESLFASKAA